MANHKSAKKRIRTSLKRRMRNKGIRTRIKNIYKKLLTVKENKEEFEKVLSIYYKELDKAVSKGVFHINTAARKKSQAAKLVKV